MIGPTALVMAAATLGDPAGACPLPTEVRITVSAQQDLVQVVSDIGLVDMEELRRRSGQQERHRTLGFYTSTVAAKIEPHQAVNPSDLCEQAVRVTVDLWLVERRIHIAREAVTLACLSDVAVSHLTHHATAEGEAFGRMVGRVEHRLQSAAFVASARAERARGEDLTVLIQAALDQELVIYDADRKRMRDETDTADEIQKIQNACS